MQRDGTAQQQSPKDLARAVAGASCPAIISCSTTATNGSKRRWTARPASAELRGHVNNFHAPCFEFRHYRTHLCRNCESPRTPLGRHREARAFEVPFCFSCCVLDDRRPLVSIVGAPLPHIARDTVLSRLCGLYGHRLPACHPAIAITALQRSYSAPLPAVAESSNSNREREQQGRDDGERSCMMDPAAIRARAASSGHHQCNEEVAANGSTLTQAYRAPTSHHRRFPASRRQTVCRPSSWCWSATAARVRGSRLLGGQPLWSSSAHLPCIAANCMCATPQARPPLSSAILRASSRRSMSVSAGRGANGCRGLFELPRRPGVVARDSWLRRHSALSCT